MQVTCCTAALRCPGLRERLHRLDVLIVDGLRGPALVRQVDDEAAGRLEAADDLTLERVTVPSWDQPHAHPAADQLAHPFRRDAHAAEDNACGVQKVGCEDQ